MLDRPTAGGIALACIATVALGAFLARLPLALDNPFFIGDSGFRMDHANELIVRSGKRFWLPYLQLHIWIAYKLGLPYTVFKVIPCVYFLATLYLLGRLGVRITGTTFGGLLFCLLVQLGFAYQSLVVFLSTNLYQEILEAALFFALLNGGALELRKRPLLVLWGVLGLLTRDTFLIYLAILTVLNARTILRDRTYAITFALLWCVPLSWLWVVRGQYALAFGRLPTWPLEWPLTVDRDGAAVSDLSRSAAGLATAVAANRLFVLLGSIALLAVIGGLRGAIRGGRPENAFRRRFKVFSAVSLTAVYGSIVLFDPWARTFGNSRMVSPLLQHAVVWSLVLYAEVGSWGKRARTAARLMLVGSLIALVSVDGRDWKVGDHSTALALHAEIQRAADAGGGGGRAQACLVNRDYWRAVALFVGPTLYMSRAFLHPHQSITNTRCTLIVSEEERGTLHSGGEAPRAFDLPGDAFWGGRYVVSRPDARPSS
jgi:hypothetical protein